MILEFLKPQLWWILQVSACVFVYIALVPSRTLGLCWKSYLFYMTISTTTCSWMFLKSYELASIHASFFQAWFIGITVLSLCGFLGSLFYFGEVLSITKYIGATVSLIGVVLLAI